MSNNVLSFPRQSTTDDEQAEFKRLALMSLEQLRKSVEKGDVTFVMILGQGPEVDGVFTWAGHLNHIAAQGLLAVANRAIQEDMITQHGAL